MLFWKAPYAFKEPGEQNINLNMLQMGLLSRQSLKNSIKLVRFIMWFEKIKNQVKKGKMPYQSSRWSSQKTRHCRSDIYHRLLKSNYYFQQDGARPHTSKRAQNYLRSKFGSGRLDLQTWIHVIIFYGPIKIIIFGYLKSRIYNPCLLYTSDAADE